MKKVSLRAYAAILVAVAILVGLVTYVGRFFSDGEDWALFFNGSKASLTVTDRNGVLLAKRETAGKYYAEDAGIRTACYQLIGDYQGNVGTGVLQSAGKLTMKYNAFFGVEDVPSKELSLSIDSELNRAAYAALGGRKGAVLVCNYKTSELLCMVSSPSIDPLDPPEELPDGAYLNRCISSTFVPGSIFKIVTLTAAIENIPDLYDRTFTCRGYSVVDGSRLGCSGIHGEQNIEKAFSNSCNCAFAELALELGPEIMKEYAEKLGITEAHSLDGAYTAAGSYDPDVSGSAGLAWSGIGQHRDLVCPYSMLRIVSAIGNGGTLYEPSLFGSTEEGVSLIAPGTAQKLAAMMSYNVADHYGRDRFPGLDIAAKTGTAELGNGEADNAWFVGFLNDEAHPYAFVVLVENGGYGLTAASPVANEVLQAAILR